MINRLVLTFVISGCSKCRLLKWHKLSYFLYLLLYWYELCTVCLKHILTMYCKGHKHTCNVVVLLHLSMNVWLFHRYINLFNNISSLQLNILCNGRHICLLKYENSRDIMGWSKYICMYCSIHNVNAKNTQNNYIK